MNARSPLRLAPSSATLVARCLCDPDLFADCTPRSNPETWALGVLQRAYDAWCERFGHPFGLVATLPQDVREAACVEIVALGWDELLRQQNAQEIDHDFDAHQQRNDAARKAA